MDVYVYEDTIHYQRYYTHTVFLRIRENCDISSTKHVRYIKIYSNTSKM